MHILVTNDDGPPDIDTSPYVLPLVRQLQASGHIVSVALPNTQRSWIGKAHLIGKTITPTYYTPSSSNHFDPSKSCHGETRARPLPASSKAEEWVLLDTTPASCVQIGLFHLFEQRGPIDFVVSGPNLGRNCTSVFALSSGTLGAALEAATCRVPSIALSFAFEGRERIADPTLIEPAIRLGVKVIESLSKDWSSDECLLRKADVFSINVPLREDVLSRRVVWTPMLKNSWMSGSAFQPIDAPAAEDGAEAAEDKVEREEAAAGNADSSEEARTPRHARYEHKLYHWAPRFSDVYASVEKAQPGNDGWAVKNGYTSVTPISANFAQVTGFKGDLAI